jgi:hypothetical protein
MADPLDELAARGREAEKRARRARDDTRTKEAREREERALLSATPLGVLRSYLGGLGVTGIALAIGCVFLVYPSIADHPSPDAAAIIELIAGLLLPVPAVLIARRVALVAGRAAHPRVLAWARSLPFHVEGLNAVLAATPERTLLVTVTFVGPADLERAAQAVTGLGRRHLAAQPDRERLRIVQGHLGFDDDAGAQAPTTNYPVVRALRWLVPHLLEPLHASEPIRSIELSLTSENLSG